MGSTLNSKRRGSNDENSGSYMNASAAQNDIYASTQHTGYAQTKGGSQMSAMHKIKHYEVPNLSSMLYEYTNKERDLVQQAFRGGNYQTIRNLPDDIRPFNVAQAMKTKIGETALTSSIMAQNNHAFNELLKGNGGVFSKFEWEREPFDNFKMFES